MLEQSWSRVGDRVMSSFVEPVDELVEDDGGGGGGGGGGSDFDIDSVDL